MKKTALLFTLLCAGVLNGMESLPSDIHGVIIKKALEASESSKEMIAALKNFGAAQGIPLDKLFGNLKTFTALVHIMADKFNEKTDLIASQFGIPIAKRYLDLAHALVTACEGSDIDQAKKLLGQGADANLTSFEFGELGSPLSRAVRRGNVELMKLLIDNGAKSTENLRKHSDIWFEDKPQKKEEIKQILEGARQK